MPVERICLECGTSFLAKPVKIRIGEAKYCPRQCSCRANHRGREKPYAAETAKLARQHKAEKGNPPWNKQEPVALTCQGCGALFSVAPNRKDTARFCSRACSAKHRAGMRGERVRRIICTCEHCGKQVKKVPSAAKRFRFCSFSCHGAWVALQRPRTSQIETRLLAAMKQQGLTPETQFVVGHFIADFAFPNDRLLVEADGDYWHFTEKGLEKEKRRDAYLAERGWQVLHFTESEIMDDTDACVGEITRLLAA